MMYIGMSIARTESYSSLSILRIDPGENQAGHKPKAPYFSAPVHHKSRHGFFYYIGSAEGHEYPDLQVGDEVNPRPFFVLS